MNNNCDENVKTWKCKRRLTEDEVVEICKSLVMHNGCVIDTYNDINRDIDVVTYDKIKSIKYKKSWTHISNMYFKHDEFDIREQPNILDKETVELICELLLKHNGSISYVMKEISVDMPNVSVNSVSSIKYKTRWVEISDKYFGKDVFDIIHQNLLDKETVELICELLVKYDGDISSVIKELFDFNTITIDNVNCIKYKLTWVDISDKYFTADAFTKKNGLHRLTKDSVRTICESIVKNKGSVLNVFKELADIIEHITIDRIITIKYKKSWVHISDEYFKAEDFVNKKEG